MPNLWRAHIRPDADPVAAYTFCVNRDILGFGWPVGTGAPLTREQYEALASLQYGPPSQDNRGWKGAINAITDHMGRGDLCWIREPGGASFHIGRIGGRWEYRTTPEYVRVNIVNVRPCFWFHYHTCPQAIRWQLGMTLQRVGDLGTVQESIDIYNRLAAVHM